MSTCKIVYDGSCISETEETSPVIITYNGNQIATVNDNEQKTLQCDGKVMSSNVAIGSKTLICAGKLMDGNVTVVVEKSVDYKTWYFNATIPNTATLAIVSITFTSNGRTYTKIRTAPASGRIQILYIGGVSTTAYSNNKWASEALRTVVFNTVPTGTLRTWLEANATPI